MYVQDLITKKTILVTHTDLDGVGCEIIFKAFGGEIVYTADYNTIDTILQDIIDNNSDDQIIITDITPSEEMAKKLDERGMVTIIDHHPKKYDYDWYIQDSSYCGTKLLYKWFEANGWYRPNFAQFVEIVDDYDRWVHGYADSKRLNSLYYILGREKFVTKIFKNWGFCSFNVTDELLLELDREDRDKQCKLALGRVFYVYGIPTVFCDSKYTSETGHFLLEKLNIDVVMLIDTINKKGSFRSKKGFDSSILAKRLDGGGHPQACGFQLDKYKLLNLGDYIYRKLVGFNIDSCREEA